MANTFAFSEYLSHLWLVHISLAGLVISLVWIAPICPICGGKQFPKTKFTTPSTNISVFTHDICSSVQVFEHLHSMMFAGLFAGWHVYNKHRDSCPELLIFRLRSSVVLARIATNSGRNRRNPASVWSQTMEWTPQEGGRVSRRIGPIGYTFIHN